MKAFLKSILNFTLFLFGRHRFPAITPQLVVLGYHRVLPADHDDMEFMQPGMVVTPETLELHLSVLKKYFEFMHLEDWLDMVRNNEPIPNRCCALTFDDGWSDNFDYALPILQKHQTPATVFLVSDMVGTNQSFWPERMFRLLQNLTKEQLNDLLKQDQNSWLNEICRINKNTELNKETIDNAIMLVKQLTDHEIINKLDVIELTLSIDSNHRDILNWHEVDQMQQNDLVRFGSHTRSHKRLDKLKLAEIEDEVVSSLKEINSKVDHQVQLFCYPNGNTTEKAEHLVQSNFIGACTTVPGWNKPSTSHYHLKRFLLHEDMCNSEIKLMACLSRTIKKF